VAYYEALFRRLSGGAREIKKAADKIVGVSVEIRTQHIPNINQKLSPLESACSVLCVAAVGIDIITCCLYVEWWVLRSVQKLTFVHYPSDVLQLYKTNQTPSVV
jgi:hypothetical protein